MKSSAPRLFCFGLGYSAKVLALDLMAKGWSVSGTCREEETVAELQKLGIEAFRFDREHVSKDITRSLAKATHLLSSVPPDDLGDAVLDCFEKEIRALTSSLSWVGYLSTTGVYGSRDGGTVREGDALRPTSDRARRRVQAESRWLALAEVGLPVHAFRLAGIYGPGRNVLEDVWAGQAQRILKPGHMFSRIHVADIAVVIGASMAHPNPGAIYNVCDDEPAQPADVIAYACALLGVSSPPLLDFAVAEQDMSAMKRTFWADNKRVDNSRIKIELGVELLYPDFRKGLQACLSSD